MTRVSKFQRGSGSYRCTSCRKMTRETGDSESSVEMCKQCYYEAGLENEHQDGYHDADDLGPNTDCPMCRTAAALAGYKADKAIKALVIERVSKLARDLAEETGIDPVRLAKFDTYADRAWRDTLTQGD